MIESRLLDILACPACRRSLGAQDETALRCEGCGRTYPVRDGIPVLLVDAAGPPSGRGDGSGDDP